MYFVYNVSLPTIILQILPPPLTSVVKKYFNLRVITIQIFVIIIFSLGTARFLLPEQYENKKICSPHILFLGYF